MALSRGTATSALRQIDSTSPNSWEFSGFSQNGEDGIIDFLTRKVLRPNRYFIEIVSGDGTENNTSWLAIARRYSGLMIEGNRKLSKWCKYILTPLSEGLETIFVEDPVRQSYWKGIQDEIKRLLYIKQTIINSFAQ